MIRRRYLFTGKVQHVGFRWRALRAAETFGCTGWCRNSPDGSVIMEIQGSRLRIMLAVLALRAGKRIRIEHTEVAPVPVDPEEQEFRPEY